MSAVGIIFANLHERNIPELTRIRAMASVPFGGRYRLIDFPLAYMVNAGITDIRVITQAHYSSLMDHIGSGKDWDLARRSGGIKILPPNINEQSGGVLVPASRLESLKNISVALDRIKSDYVVLSDCDVICNPDIGKLLQRHAQAAQKSPCWSAARNFTGRCRIRPLWWILTSRGGLPACRSTRSMSRGSGTET